MQKFIINESSFKLIKKKNNRILLCKDGLTNATELVWPICRVYLTIHKMGLFQYYIALGGGGKAVMNLRYLKDQTVKVW